MAAKWRQQACGEWSADFLQELEEYEADPCISDNLDALLRAVGLKIAAWLGPL